MSRSAVLVVDDDPVFREIMALSLEAMGFSVLQSPDCTDAIALFERAEEEIHAILLDYFMPGLPPSECARRLMKLAGDVPIILVTAAPDAASRATELGCTRWLSKPFSPAQLKRVLA